MSETGRKDQVQNPEQSPNTEPGKHSDCVREQKHHQSGNRCDQVRLIRVGHISTERQEVASIIQTAIPDHSSPHPDASLCDEPAVRFSSDLLDSFVMFRVLH